MSRWPTIDWTGRLLPWWLAYAIYQAWAIGLGSFWFYFRMLQSGAERPHLSTGQTMAVNNHGQNFYVEPWQATLHIFGLVGSVFAFAALFVWAQSRYGRESLAATRPLPFVAAVVGAVVFWHFAPQVARLLWA